MPSSRRILRILVSFACPVAIIAIPVTGSIRIIDAGNIGLLLHFGAVDISKSWKKAFILLFQYAMKW